MGSAQVRKDGVILQHGSLLLTFAPQQVAALLNLPSAAARETVAAMLAKKAISLRDAAQRDITWEEACQAMQAAVGPALGVQLAPGELGAEEQAAILELIAGKYSQDSWNLLR